MEVEREIVKECSGGVNSHPRMDNSGAILQKDAFN